MSWVQVYDPAGSVWLSTLAAALPTGLLPVTLGVLRWPAHGVMGRMVAAQTIVVATAATHQQGEEGALLRSVFWHSLALAALMGLIIMAQA